MRLLLSLTFTTVLLFVAAPATALVVELYDADDATDPLISDQGNLFFFAGLIGPGTQVASAIGTDLSTTGVGQTGYSDAIDLNLDRTAGFTLDIDLQVQSESHSSANRAGFSIIMVSSDLQAIEISFWQDEIWAQNVGFTHGEGTGVFDTTAAVTTYSLAVLGSGYTLSADGGMILSGSLRDYSGVAVPDVYAIPNFLFLGDNTTSAQAVVSIGDIRLTTIPLPPSAYLLLSAMAFFVRRSKS